MMKSLLNLPLELLERMLVYALLLRLLNDYLRSYMKTRQFRFERFV